MINLRCNVCGGQLDIVEGESVCVCDSCGCKQVVPKIDDDKIARLYDRANHHRRQNEFDKAMGVYELILSENGEDCEAYWGIVLCRYGIEYVEDPKNGKHVPTVNRAQYVSIFDDDDFKKAMQYADGYQRDVYEAAAKEIDDIQRGILAISQREDPYDIFICYKETDNNGRRTSDSVFAQDIYKELTKEGYKVFFSRITLEDKLGSAYEPYIFAALNSAKVMLVVGTKPEYFNAVWVKNEWSRFLALAKNDDSKTIIPLYKDMDPYDLPEEFGYLQSQDMGKIGYMQDLVHGINKLIGKQPVVVSVARGVNSDIEPLLERAFIFLNDRDFNSADEYCERVLDKDPKNARAYLGKLMASLGVSRKEFLKNEKEPFNTNQYYSKVMAYADEQLINELKDYIKIIENRNNEAIYQKYCEKIDRTYKSSEIDEIIKGFVSIINYKDSSEKIKQLKEKKKELIEKEAREYKESIYIKACNMLQNAGVNNIDDLLLAKDQFRQISGYRDSKQKMDECDEKRTELANKRVYDYCNEVLTNSNEIDKLEMAKANFQKISGYRDSAYKVVECEKKIANIIEQIKKREKDNKKNLLLVNVITLAIWAISMSCLFTICLKSSLSFCIFFVLVNMFFQFFAVLNNSKKHRGRTISFYIFNTLYTIGTGLFAFFSLGFQSSILECLALIVTCMIVPFTIVGLKQKALKSEEKTKKSVKTSLIILIVLLSSLAIFGIGYNVTQNAKLNQAFDDLENGNIKDGVEQIVAVGDFKKNNEKTQKKKYEIATKLLEQGDERNAAALFLSAGDYSDSLEKANELLDKLYNRKSTISVWDNAVGIKTDGTAVGAGTSKKFSSSSVAEWKDIVSVAAGGYNVFGLKADGTVVVINTHTDKDNGQLNVYAWTDIVSISSCYTRTVGLKADGTVVHTDMFDTEQQSMDNWENIVAISTCWGYTLGLKSDGTVVVAGDVDHYGPDVSEWTDIVAISAGYHHAIGLKSDGTVVTAGDNYDEVSSWTDIVAIQAGDGYTLGLKSDGTVVAVGENGYGQCDVDDWTDIVAIATKSTYTVGLKSDGTVVHTYDKFLEDSYFEDWTDIRVPQK